MEDGTRARLARRFPCDFYQREGGDRKRTNGVSTSGVTADVVFFDRGTFWVLPLTYSYLPKSARAYLFPQSVKTRYFCGGPTSVDPDLSENQGEVRPLEDRGGHPFWGAGNHRWNRNPRPQPSLVKWCF